MNSCITHKWEKHGLLRSVFVVVVMSLQSLGQVRNGPVGCSGDDCTGRIEAFKMSEHPKGPFNGRNTVFIISHVPVLELPLYLSRNGINLTIGKDFRTVSNQITLSSPPNGGDTLTISYYSLPALMKTTQTRNIAAQTPAIDNSVISFAESAVRSAMAAEAEDSEQVRPDYPHRASARHVEEQSKGVNLLLERTQRPIEKTHGIRKGQSSSQGLEGVGDIPFRSTMAGTNDAIDFEDDKLLKLLQRAIDSNTSPVVHR